MTRIVGRSRHDGKFELIALAIVLAIVVWIGVGSRTAEPNARATIASMPASVQVRRREFQTQKQRHDNELMGLSPQVPTLLVRDQTYGVYVILGNKTNWCYYQDVQTTPDEVVYRGIPDPYVPLALSLRMPRNPDYENPCGIWAFYLRNEDGRAKASDWMLLQKDGTGYCGWDPKFDATTATVEEMREDGTPCTWHVTTVKGGCLVVLEYEGGQSVVALTL